MWMNEWIDYSWIHRLLGEWKNRLFVEWMNRLLGEWSDGLLGKWMNRLLVEWMNDEEEDQLRSEYRHIIKLNKLLTLPNIMFEQNL